ncbi:efflux RND transporter periplasmic adaptor subunit [Brachybacterium huguangmaarense]
MESVRRYVFPVIWMVIIGLIAAALVKLAFFGGAPATADDESPTADVGAFRTVPVGRGDIASTLDLTATVSPDEGTSVRATDAGEITSLWVKNGDAVQAGDRILQVRVEKEAAAAPVDPAADPAAAAAPAKPGYRYYTLTASGSGTIRDLAVLKGQQLAIGDTVATLSPGTYSIVADLTPEQQLRMLDVPVVATAQLPDSPDPVACQAPSIDEQDPSKDDEQAPSTTIDPMTGMPVSADSAAARLRCPVPPGTRIVPGLTVTVTVDLGTATDVLTVPLTAVEGTGTAGNVYVLDDATGEPTPVPVTIGKRGPDTVEISGIDEGTEVLQYVPGVAADPMETGLGW